MPNYYDLGDYLFVSMSPSGKGISNKSIVGSIYYQYGRMRLVHAHGPTIEIRPYDEYVAYFVLPIRYNKSEFSFKGRSFGEIYNCISTKLEGLLLDITDSYFIHEVSKKCEITCQTQPIYPEMNNYFLYEIYFNKYTFIATDQHHSRGYPRRVEIQYIDTIGEQMSDYAQKYYGEKTDNDAIYGCFYSFYNYYSILPPFDLYNPMKLYDD